MRNFFVLLVALVSLLPFVDANAGSHTWRIHEVFSDSSGTFQYIEMHQIAEGESEYHVGGKSFYTSLYPYSGNYTFSNDLEPPTGIGKKFLMATQAFADLPGTPTPDFIIPGPFFSIDGDELRLSSYDTMSFASGQLPTDGTTSMNRDYTTATGTPTNYAGETFNLGQSTPPGIPALPLVAPLVLAGMILAEGRVRLRAARS